MNKHLWSRPLRFYRTMDEAFKTPRYGCAVEYPTRRRSGLGLWAAISVAAVVAVAVMVAK